MFIFFFRSCRRGPLDFCGSKVEVEFDPEGPDCKECFRLFEDGFYKGKTITSRHPNITRTVIIGKKAWGLWKNEWSEGISEGTFTFGEILREFTDLDIEVPEPLLEDFHNTIWKKTQNRMKKKDDHA